MARKPQKKDNFLEGKTVIDIQPSAPESQKPQSVQQKERKAVDEWPKDKKGRPVLSDEYLEYLREKDEEFWRKVVDNRSRNFSMFFTTSGWKEVKVKCPCCGLTDWIKVKGEEYHCASCCSNGHISDLIYKDDLKHNSEFSNSELKDMFEGVGDDKIELNLEDKNNKKRGRPLKDGVIRDKSSQRGLTKDWSRKTYIVRCKYIQEIKNMAKKMMITEKEVLDMALAKFLDIQESG